MSENLPPDLPPPMPSGEPWTLYRAKHWATTPIPGSGGSLFWEPCTCRALENHMKKDTLPFEVDDLQPAHNRPEPVSAASVKTATWEGGAWAPPRKEFPWALLLASLGAVMGAAGLLMKLVP